MGVAQVQHVRTHSLYFFTQSERKMTEQNIKVELAVIQTDMTYLKKHMEIIEQKIDNMMISISNTYASKNSFEHLKKRVDNLYEDRKETNTKISDRVYEAIKYIIIIIFTAAFTWVVSGGMS